jgi:hypothetical protein
MLKFLVLLVLSFNIFASENIKGEGKFYSSDEDSLSFIKEELTFLGFIDVISKRLEENGLNKELFWQKYEEKFAKRFEIIEESYRKKYNIDEKPTAQEKENFTKTLRKRKLLEKRKFGNLQRVIQSYSIEKTSRSAQNPQIRYIKLQAKVNDQVLNKIYYEFVQGKKTGDYGTLYVHVEFNLKNATYTDLGISSEKDFVNAVSNAWLRSFEKNKPSNIQAIEILEGSRLKALNEYLKLPYERMIQEIPDDFKNSLYLKVDIDIEKLNYEKAVEKYVFKYDGGLFLQDLQNLQILSSDHFKTKQKEFTLSVTSSSLGTLLATDITYIPQAAFSDIQSKIKNIPPMTTIQRIALYDFKNIASVYDLIESIKAQGIKYSLKAKLESIGKERAEIIVFYDGVEANLKEILSGIKPAKNGQTYDVIDSDTVLGIKFNKLGESETL